MTSLPFSIERFRFDAPGDATIGVSLVPPSQLAQPNPIPGYFVMSTAPPNIELAKPDSLEAQREVATGIDAIASELYQRHQQGKSPELVIAIHGYNTRKSAAISWFSDIFRIINRRDESIRLAGNQVFIGFRWPSETISLTQLKNALAAMPTPLRVLLGFGLGGSAIAYGVTLTQQQGWQVTLGVLGVGSFALLTTLVITLMLLRTVVYFRDLYRATNFGVLDFVDLIRRLDQALLEKAAADFARSVSTDSGEAPDEATITRNALQYWEREPQRKVRLAFIGHSMGALVVTNAVRVLSDVFDSRSIRQQPPADLGFTFRLERLVLVSPDIPILSMISSRANVLSSSLRRFSESYLFSNEADLALRLASTAANYISFPSQTRDRGYRLGNVAIFAKQAKQQNAKRSIKRFGIINSPSLEQHYAHDQPAELVQAITTDPDRILARLFISPTTQRRPVTLLELFAEQECWETQGSREKEGAEELINLTDLFTVFDCTDYCDYTADAAGRSSSGKRGLLSRVKKKPVLSFWDYLPLLFNYWLGGLDVHGGYFQGETGQALIYRLGFLGFDGLLASYGEQPDIGLTQLDHHCQNLGIQVFLSPVRHWVSLKQHALDDVKKHLLARIRL